MESSNWENSNDLAVSVVSFISRSTGEMRSTKSPNLELLGKNVIFIAEREIKGSG